jgi:hypothetical protein
MSVEIDITIRVDEKSLHDAARYTLSVEDHLKHMIEVWAKAAQDENPGLDLATLPTKAELAADQKKQDIADIEAFQKTERERKGKQAIAERERQVQQDARDEIEQKNAQKNRNAEVAEQVRLALQDPNVLKQAAVAQGMALVAAETVEK